MTASDFNTLIRNFPQSDTAAAAKLEDEILHAGYCQSLYVLLARIKQNDQDPTSSLFIQKAAVHSADRGHLKRLLEQQVTLAAAQPEPTSKIQELARQVLPATEQTTDTSAEEVSEISENKDSVISDSSAPSLPIAEEVQTDILILKEKVKQFSELPSVAKRSLDRFLEQRPEKVSKEVVVEKVVTPLRAQKTQDETDLLLNEIKSSRKKVKTDNGRQAEQLAIIDQFIRSNLVTIKPPEKGTRRQDLTESSESYSENVISETLVDILIRQGKKEKAIDVLRKLIWKFPQKKHLFAARIQELSK